MPMMQWCSAVARRVLMRERTALTSPLSSSRTTGGPFPILCGRGDKRTKKGKRFKGSYGNSRPKKEKKIERIKDKVEVPRLPFGTLIELQKLNSEFIDSIFVNGLSTYYVGT